MFDMGFLNKYPYTDFHELNLDWLIRALKEYVAELHDFVLINAIKYADPIQWDITRQYEKNTVVVDPLTGIAYISVDAVPGGVSLSRTEYWTVIFDLSRFINAANNNFTFRVETMTTTTATFNTPVDGWLVWNQELYRAKVSITAGDAYVIDGNIERIRVEDMLQELATTLQAITGDLNDLTTTDKTNLVAAINEVLAAVGSVASDLTNTAGDLNDLDTTDKTNLVAAINEVLAAVTTVAGDLVNTAGDLNDLDTTDKSNLVAAINEVLAGVGSVAADLANTAGDLNDLNTTDKTNLVAAINEVLSVATSGGAGFVYPDQFAGATDADKLQAAIDYAMANDYPVIVINREYDITGATLTMTKGIRVTDYNGPYARKNLTFMGTGTGRISKKDAGYMFDAASKSGDFLFINVTFSGYTTDQAVTGVVDMKVFNCENLIRIYSMGCVFEYCGCVYYQNDASNAFAAQSIVSTGNLYAKNKCVLYGKSLYDARFVNDTIENGARFIHGIQDSGAAFRGLKVISCTIEGHTSDPAIECNNVVINGTFSFNYFEGNAGHILLGYNFGGTIIGNSFHSRGSISASLAISCIEVALANDQYLIKANYCIDSNPLTTLLVFNTSSPYYDATRKVFGPGIAESGSTLTNISANVIGEADGVNAIMSDSTSQTVDLTSDMQSVYTAITGGTITYFRRGSLRGVSFYNMTTNGVIGSGINSIDTAYLTPELGIQYSGVLVDNSAQKVGKVYIETGGEIGIRVPAAGTYSGQIIFN